MLGKTVKVTVDRPLGSVHPKYKNIVYPVNYGYVDGIIAPDGEEQDAYILGVNVPVKEFVGKVIAIIHRNDDIEEKWVVAPDDTAFSQNEIAEQTYFQEQYFDIEIEALYHKSCGAVVFRKSQKGIEYLCIFQKASQTYSVPKGHMEAYENEEQTAKREIKEEIGVSVDFTPGYRETVQYKTLDGKLKTVALFLAECDKEISNNKNEIESFAWLPFEKAKTILPPWYSPILEKTEHLLMQKIM